MDKQKYRLIQKKISELWNEFDPIGVVEFGVIDEYEMYVWPTFRLLKNESDEKTLIQFVEYNVHERIGLTSSHNSKTKIQKFVSKLNRIPTDM